MTMPTRWTPCWNGQNATDLTRTAHHRGSDRPDQRAGGPERMHDARSGSQLDGQRALPVCMPHSHPRVPSIAIGDPARPWRATPCMSTSGQRHWSVGTELERDRNFGSHSRIFAAAWNRDRSGDRKSLPHRLRALSPVSRRGSVAGVRQVDGVAGPAAARAARAAAGCRRRPWHLCRTAGQARVPRTSGRSGAAARGAGTPGSRPRSRLRLHRRRGRRARASRSEPSRRMRCCCSGRCTT